MIQFIFVVCINLPTFAYQQLSFDLINQTVSINFGRNHCIIEEMAKQLCNNAFLIIALNPLIYF